MAKDAIEGLEPKILWERFYEITQVPHPSKKEGKIREHLKNLLSELKVEFKEDSAGNIVAYLPATEGYENAPTVILQGHIDMVCEKNKDKKHDFENDPLTILRDDGWITADGTTLGSDNGIGVAAALAVITDTNIVHGPIEILMTVDEETGLTGASNLQSDLLSGKILLNMDSEEDGAFYVGCAGGVDTLGSFEIQTENLPENKKAYKILITGLKGGHSGLDIQFGRGNAIKILARTLNSLGDLGYRISELDGGSLRNAIPREAEAVLFLSEDESTKAGNIINEFEKKVKNELKSVDGEVAILFKETKDKFDKVYMRDYSDRIIDVLLALPHGVIAMSNDIEGLVETSTNLATIKVNNNLITIGTSQRSSVESSKDYIANSVTSVFKLANAQIELGDGYPGWKPNMDSKVLQISKNVFKDLFGKEPEIKAIHAGLECGILEGKKPGLDMISFGPTIQGAHSPDERVNIETVGKFYELMKGILKHLAEN